MKTMIKDKKIDVSTIDLKMYVLMTLAIFIVYGNTINHGFVLDDVAVIEQNKFVKSGIEGLGGILTGFYWKGYWDTNSGIYRPLSLISFALEYEVFPNKPGIHHFFNIFYYTISILLLLKIIAYFFPTRDKLIIFLVVGLFAFHPTHTEVVANIKSRDEIFSLLFILSSIYVLLFIKMKEKFKYILASFFFFLALLSKEGSIVFLPMLFIFDIANGLSLRSFFRIRFWFILLTIIWLIVHVLVISSDGGMVDYTYNDNSLLYTDNILLQKITAIGMFGDYVFKAWFPFSFSYDYSFNQIPIIGVTSFKFILGLSLFLFHLFGVLYFWKNNKKVMSILVLFLFPLLMTSNILFTIGATFADRFLFIPTLSLIPAFFLIMDWFDKKKMGLSIIILLVFLDLFFCYKTVGRNDDWKSNKTLFSKDVHTSKASARTHFNYATMLMNNYHFVGDDVFKNSKTEFENCLSIDSLYVDAMINYSTLLTLEGNYSLSKQYLLKSIKLKMNDPILLGSLGEVCFRLSQFSESKEYLLASINAGNKIDIMNNYLGTIYFNEKDYFKAIEYFENGLKLDPRNENINLNLANVYAQIGNYKLAIQYFNSVLKLNPNNKSAINGLKLISSLRN